MIIVVAGIVGWRLLRAPVITAAQHTHIAINHRLGVAALVVFFTLLFGLPLLRSLAPSQPIALLDSFYRVGALVFGGGHVVLPFLQAEVVPSGWVTSEQFVAGYGAAQAVPGPLFTFAAYLGAVMQSHPNGWAGAVVTLTAIFMPSFLLVIGTLPVWDVLRSKVSFQSALRGINAAVVGILLAALYHPVWTSSVHTAADFGLVITSLGLLMVWKLPPWLVVILSAVGGAALAGLR